MIRGDLIKKYASATPHVKRVLSYSIIAIIIIFVSFLMYHSKKKSVTHHNHSNHVRFEEIVPEIKLLQKNLYEETRLKTQRMAIQLNKITGELKQTRLELQQQHQQTIELSKQYNKQIAHLQQTINKLTALLKKQSPSYPPAQKTTTPISYPAHKQKTLKPEWVGGILVKYVKEKKSKVSYTRKKKKHQFSVYLPPSFVQADLLNGFAAFSSHKGEKEPVRALFRLRDLAVLPNEVKADLQGCFVIGEARGDLSDERAHVRLLRLSCIGRDGSSVIDSPVQGWVVDEDGKIGLRGIVVTKMGAFLTRYMLAGFLQGFGEAYSQSQQYTTYSSSSGVVTLPSPGQATKAGLAKGIAKAGKGLADFYLELAKQTLPIIEIGAGKKVTIVFSKGQMLKIKNVCLEGRNGCRKKFKQDSLSVLVNYL